MVTQSHKAIANQKYNRFELVPKYNDQAVEIHQAFELAYKHGGWTLYNDEEWYIEERLHLVKDVEMLLTQGRSKFLTLMMGAQRPSRITRFVLSQATHVLCFAVEGRDAKVLADATSPAIQPVVTDLNLLKHEFVWWHRKTRGMWRGTLQHLGGKV